ncbi:hypothetical protein C2G38_2213272 [Gigaspora rosea]|uniref:Uncharacterized protein n=1 Tax=Gigaspora rosea TaxID=44941 RepID=A0A397UCB3_9GLOM|nr:hypothetical protein C2G38_2213272 [Gigaspora rosea]
MEPMELNGYVNGDQKTSIHSELHWLHSQLHWAPLPTLLQSSFPIARGKIVRYQHVKPPKVNVEDPQIGDYPNLPVEFKLDRPPLGWED